MQLRTLTRLKDDLVAVASHDLKNPLRGFELAAEALLCTQSGLEARNRDLLENMASKASPKSSRISIRVATAKDGVEFTVMDEGSGIPQEELEQLFARGARPTNKKSGGGFGLAICKGLVELHGGQIGARNLPQRGAEFWFKLPLAASPPRTSLVL